MSAASRLANCLLKNLSQCDLPLSSEYAELAHFAATYLWYGCCGGGSPKSEDGIGCDLSEKDCVQFDCCCQYLELLLLGRMEAASVPKQLAVILKSFRKPPTVAWWKVVIAGLRRVLRSIISCIEAADSAETDCRLPLACCLTESVAVIVPFLVTFQNSKAAEVTAQDFLSSLETIIPSDSIGQSNLDALELIGSMLVTFVQSTASVKPSKEPNTFSLQIVEKCLSSLHSSLQEFQPYFAKIRLAVARVAVASIDSLVTLLLENKGDDTLSADGLETAIELYTCELELCEAALLRYQRLQSQSDRMCQILCLKRDIWFRKLQLINVHIQKDSGVVTGIYKLFLELFIKIM